MQDFPALPGDADWRRDPIVHSYRNGHSGRDATNDDGDNVLLPEWRKQSLKRQVIVSTNSALQISFASQNGEGRETFRDYLQSAKGLGAFEIDALCQKKARPAKAERDVSYILGGDSEKITAPE